MAKHVTIGVGLCVFEAVFSIHVNPIVKYDAGLGLLVFGSDKPTSTSTTGGIENVALENDHVTGLEVTSFYIPAFSIAPYKNNLSAYHYSYCV